MLRMQCIHHEPFSAHAHMSMRRHLRQTRLHTHVRRKPGRTTRELYARVHRQHTFKHSERHRLSVQHGTQHRHSCQDISSETCHDAKLYSGYARESPTVCQKAVHFDWPVSIPEHWCVNAPRFDWPFRNPYAGTTSVFEEASAGGPTKRRA